MSPGRFRLCLPLVVFCGFSAPLPGAHACGVQEFCYEKGVIFVAGGVGGSTRLEDNLRSLVADSGWPLRIVPVHWASGDLADSMCNPATHHAAGWCLARCVLRYRQLNPGGKVYLISHSAGSAVLLSAADQLPADSVDRIILLSPTASCHYDLRPALRASRCGIDLFFSRDDNGLELYADLIGTSEWRGSMLAGKVGFCPVVASPADALLYRKLRQHPWCPEYAERGYLGGHFDVMRKCFLQQYVLPLMLEP